MGYPRTKSVEPFIGHNSTIKITYPHKPEPDRYMQYLPVDNFFLNRWDSDSSFALWPVKENKNDKKKKKKNTDKVDDSFGNLLYGISFDVFMTKETIYQFKGFFIERNF